MDPIDRIARTVYATLNDLPEENFDSEDPQTQDLYRRGGTAVLDVLGAVGIQDRALTLSEAAEKAGSGATGDWLRDYAAPPAPAAPLREGEGSAVIEGFLVSPIGDDWFVTGTANINIATGAIIKLLTDLNGEHALLTDIAAGLIASTPVAGTRWTEVTGFDGDITLQQAVGDTLPDEFPGVMFYNETNAAVEVTPVADDHAHVVVVDDVEAIVEAARADAVDDEAERADADNADADEHVSALPPLELPVFNPGNSFDSIINKKD